MGFLVLEAKRVQLKYFHLATFCDNMTTVVWAYNLLNPKSAIVSYLIRLLGLHMNQAKISSMIPHHIEGEDNIMADIISCAFKTGKLFAASNDLVSYFNTRFYLMNNESWN